MDYFDLNRRDEYWNALVLERLESAGEPDYVSQVRKAFTNGSVVFAQFRASQAPELLAMVHSAYRDQSEFPGRMLCRPEIARVLGVEGICSTAAVGFEHVDEFACVALLARALDGGGAYGPWRPAGRSQEIAAAAALLDVAIPPGDSGVIYCSSEAWCGFFLEAAWDLSFTSLTRHGLVTFLAATDTD